MYQPFISEAGCAYTIKIRVRSSTNSLIFPPPSQNYSNGCFLNSFRLIVGYPVRKEENAQVHLLWRGVDMVKHAWSPRNIKCRRDEKNGSLKILPTTHSVQLRGLPPLSPKGGGNPKGQVPPLTPISIFFSDACLRPCSTGRGSTDPERP
jgi:hypothetical protein